VDSDCRGPLPPPEQAGLPYPHQGFESLYGGFCPKGPPGQVAQTLGQAKITLLWRFPALRSPIWTPMKSPKVRRRNWRVIRRQFRSHPGLRLAAPPEGVFTAEERRACL